MNLMKSAGRQRGVVLVIALIMLLAVTLMVVTASNLVQTNLKIVQNMESHELARFAALAAIEEAISSDRFTDEPGDVFLAKCNLTPNLKCYNFNGDPDEDFDDIVVEVFEPSGVSVTPTPNDELDVYGSEQEASCFLPPAVYSMCAYSVWDFRATATDPLTGARVSVRQGVSILTALNKIDTECPV